MAEPKVGLMSVAGYVPRYRLSGQVTRVVWGGDGGQRAVANYDEDALTMACEAGLAALAGRAPDTVGACFFASTSAPCVEKSNATLLATVADLPAEVLTADLGGSLRCGTTALRLALDAVAAGSARAALVAAGDMRPVAPGGELELVIGDGAGAALAGGEALIATFQGAYATSREFTDLWRNDGDRYVQALLFEATDAITAWRPRRAVAEQLAGGRRLDAYGKFLRFRRHVETEIVRSFSSVPTLVREERQNLRLYGQQCEDWGP